MRLKAAADEDDVTSALRRGPAAYGLARCALLRPILAVCAATAMCASTVPASAAGSRDTDDPISPRVLARPDPGPVPVDEDARNSPGGADTPVLVRRLNLNDVHALAAAISREAFPHGASTAYLARSDDLTDALVAGQLSDGPILLVPSSGTAPAPVRAEIARLKVARVVAIGGERAVPAAMLASAANGRATGRIAGANGYQTAAAIARVAFGEAANGSGGVAYVVARSGLADGAVSGQLVDGPVLVAPPAAGRTRPAGAPGALAGTVTGIGGKGVLPDHVLNSLPASGGNVSRIAGNDRYATAASVARHGFASGSSTVYLASGSDLSAAVAAGGIQGSAVLLVPRCGEVPSSVMTELRRLAPREVVLLGGTRQICASVAEQVSGLR